MSISIDFDRGRRAAQTLYHAFATTGIHGRTDMPEDEPPGGVQHGSPEHALFITLTVAIDYQRDAPALWDSSRRTWQDPETQYLFVPRLLHEAPAAKIAQDMQRYGLSRKPQKDSHIWRTVGVTLHKKWNGDPRRFLADCGWAAPTILDRLRSDSHVYNGRFVPDYPYLRGPKIGPLWLRMLRDNVSMAELTDLDKVPIPVDIHVARATLCLGVVRGKFDGPMTELFKHVRTAWTGSVVGLSADSRPMIALDVDEPLWHLSKYGCARRKEAGRQCPMLGTCEAVEYCVPGTITMTKQRVGMDT